LKTISLTFAHHFKNLVMVLIIFSITGISLAHSQSQYEAGTVKKTILLSNQLGDYSKNTKLLMIDNNVSELVNPLLFSGGANQVKPSADMVKCGSGEVQTFSQSIKKNLSLIGTSLESTHCNSIEEFNKTKQLNENICLGLAGCFKKNYKNKSDSIIGTVVKAKALVAEEVIGLTAQSSISEMLDFEALKVFAASKYGHNFIPAICKDVKVFNPGDYVGSGGNKCRTDVVDAGLLMAMKNCKLPNKHCYPGYTEYANGKQRVPGQSLASDFFEQTAVLNSMDIITQSTDITSHLASIYASQAKTEEEKVSESFAYLSANYLYLDPVFKSYFNKSLDSIATGKVDVIRTSLVKWLKENKNKNSDVFEKELDQLRQAEIKEILEKKCQTSITMSGLCQLADEAIAGTETPVEADDFFKMLSMEEPLSLNSPNFEEHLAKNIARCETFSLKKSHKGMVVSNQSLAHKWDLFASIDNDFRTFTPRKNAMNNLASGTVIKMGKDGVLERHVAVYGELLASRSKGNEDSNNEKTSDLFLVRKFSSSNERRKDSSESEGFVGPNNNGQKKDIVEEHVVVRDHNESKVVKGISENLYSDSRVIAQDKIKPQAGDRVDSFNSIQADNQEIKDSENAKNNNSALVSKIAELETRLKQMNTPEQEIKRKISDSSSAVKKVDDESAVTKELASLQAELDAMKKAPVKKAVVSVASPTANIEQEQIRNKVFSNTLQNSISAESSVANSRAPSAVAPSTNSSSVSESSRSSGASVGPSSKEASAAISGNSSNSDSGGKIESIVLAKIDSSNGALASRESISNMIFAESGKPFYIEEEGLVKYIVPEVVDGKIIVDDKGQPVFKKIVKGKIGEFKIADNDKKKKKATSPADVKKMDELNRRPVIRYKEFKDVIKASGVIKADTDV